MAPYLDLAARDRDHRAYSRRKRKIEPQHAAGKGRFLRLSFTVRCFLMSVVTRVGNARGVTVSYVPRVEKWSHGKTKAKKTRRFCLVFDCKKGAFGIGAVRHRFFARRPRGAVGAVRASCSSRKLLQKHAPGRRSGGFCVWAWLGSARGTGGVALAMVGTLTGSLSLVLAQLLISREFSSRPSPPCLPSGLASLTSSSPAPCHCGRAASHPAHPSASP